MDNEQGQTVISTDVEITGTVRSTGSIRIDGKLDGELLCEKDALIGKSAVIKGNLAVTSVVVEGAVNGNIVARDRIELKTSARITGDIKAKRLSVEEGVMFVGKSEVNPSGQAVPAEEAPVSSAGLVSNSAVRDPRAGAFPKR